MDGSETGVREKILTDKKIALVFVDVTGPARLLERSHLCGPAAGLVQAEALACVALLGAELNHPKETVALRLRVSGPIAGLLVENMAGGGLRGYTNNKVLHDLDTLERIDDLSILGDLGEMSVVRSIPGKTLSTAMINVTPASLRTGLQEYFTKSLQRSVKILVEASSTVEGVVFARALMLECMPDADKRAFSGVLRRLERGGVAEALRHPVTLKDICAMLHLEAGAPGESEPLEFRCRCSIARVIKMVSGLPDADIKDMVHGSQPSQIVCHMCGTGYHVGKDLLWSILEKRGHDLDLGEELDYN
jgi:molecular chaperone Hsp33